MPDARPTLCRFVRRTRKGSQRPPVFEATDGANYVIKLDQDAPDFPAAELVAAELARSFGVPIPAFAVIDCPEELLEAMTASGDAELTGFAESFRRCGGCCFGSRYLPEPVMTWRKTLRAQVAGVDEVLARVLVFDGFIENMDRAAEHNPNLLVSRGELFAIDHGQGLPAVHGVGGGLPYPFDGHIAWDVVERNADLLAEPIEDLRRLPDDAIDAAVAVVPASWWADEARPAATRRSLRERRDRLPSILGRLMERI